MYMMKIHCVCVCDFLNLSFLIGAYCHKFRAQRPTFTTNPSPPGGGGVLLKVLAIRVFLPDFVAIRPRRRRKITNFRPLTGSDPFGKHVSVRQRD